jgi:hypothetical protein
VVEVDHPAEPDEPSWLLVVCVCCDGSPLPLLGGGLLPAAPTVTVSVVVVSEPPEEVVVVDWSAGAGVLDASVVVPLVEDEGRTVVCV